MKNRSTLIKIMPLAIYAVISISHSVLMLF